MAGLIAVAAALLQAEKVNVQRNEGWGGGNGKRTVQSETSTITSVRALLFNEILSQ